MFEHFYAFRKVSTDRPMIKGYLIATHSYVFRTEKEAYIVQVEEYQNNIFIIKFFRKRDRHNKNKFSVLTGERKSTRIISTCIRILLSIREKNKYANFGFLGSHTINKEFVENKSNTIRFRIYKRAMENLIGEGVFKHSEDPSHSTYLMVNKHNTSVYEVLSEAKAMFNEIFPELDD